MMHDAGDTTMVLLWYHIDDAGDTTMVLLGYHIDDADDTTMALLGYHIDVVATVGYHIRVNSKPRSVGLVLSARRDPFKRQRRQRSKHLCEWHFVFI